MSLVEEQSVAMTQEQFEELARQAIRIDKSLRLEYVAGRLGVKRMPDGDHGRIIAWLTGLCIQTNAGWWIYPDQGLRVESYRKGNARPDGVLVPIDAFVGQGEWASADEVVMAVEVTSHDSDTERRDRLDKPRAYAETGIPVYLLIDRDSCEVKVHSRPDPDRGKYERVENVPFGKSLTLPDPVGIDIDTEPLKDWVR